jgi:hypothetical protein
LEIFGIEQALELIARQNSVMFFAQNRAVCHMLDCCHHPCVLLSTSLFKHPAFVHISHFVQLSVGFFHDEYSFVG